MHNAQCTMHNAEGYLSNFLLFSPSGSLDASNLSSTLSDICLADLKKIL